MAAGLAELSFWSSVVPTWPAGDSQRAAVAWPWPRGSLTTSPGSLPHPGPTTLLITKTLQLCLSHSLGILGPESLGDLAKRPWPFPLGVPRAWKFLLPGSGVCGL